MAPVQKRKIPENEQQKGCVIFEPVILCNQGVAYGINLIERHVDLKAPPYRVGGIDE